MNEEGAAGLAVDLVDLKDVADRELLLAAASADNRVHRELLTSLPVSSDTLMRGRMASRVGLWWVWGKGTPAPRHKGTECPRGGSNQGRVRV